MGSSSKLPEELSVGLCGPLLPPAGSALTRVLAYKSGRKDRPNQLQSQPVIKDDISGAIVRQGAPTFTVHPPAAVPPGSPAAFSSTLKQSQN